MSETILPPNENCASAQLPKPVQNDVEVAEKAFVLETLSKMCDEV